MPLLFITCTPSTCTRIRRDINLDYKTHGLYFDLSSPDETMRRITMLPERMPDEVKNMLTTFYSNVISELDSKSANEMLVKSTPKTATMSNQQQLQLRGSANESGNKGGISGVTSGSNMGSGMTTGPARVEKYCQYPITGSNTVSVTQEDYFCLEDESFLNDVIIDFYFKWIHHSIIPLESRDKTHIFTTYFYKRLTTRPPK